MNKNDINNFAIKNNIYLNNNELNYIYSFIKNNYQELIDNPNNFNIDNYKDNFTNENYLKINNLIKEYKEKYNLN